MGSGAHGPIRLRRPRRFLPMPRHQIARATDAASPALMSTLSTIRSRCFSPVVDLVVAENDLAEPGTVYLHARVAVVAFHCRQAAEDHRPFALGNDTAAPTSGPPGITEIASRGTPAWKNAFRHAVGCPRLLWAGLEHQADLHGNDGHPERVYARGIRWEHH